MRLWPILRREFLERARSRAFLLGTLLGPVLMAAVILVPGLLLEGQGRQPLRLAVLDQSGALRADLEAALASRERAGLPRYAVRPPGDGSVATLRARLKGQVLQGSLDGYLYLPVDALAGSTAEYHGRNVSNVVELGDLERVVEEVVVGARLRAEGVAAERAAGVLRRLELKKFRLSPKSEREDRGASFLLSLVLVMALYTAVALWGAALMNGVIEEKANRVVEVIVSSVRPWELFAGKLLGIGAVGLIQFLVWNAFLLSLSLLGAARAPGLGVGFPELQPFVLALFVVYFLLGYLLYGAMYAAVGAAVNSQAEAQSLAFPVMMPLVLGVMLFPMVLSHPDSPLTVFCSFVPFWAPLLMFLRVATLTPPVGQILLSILTLSASVACVLWLAARIYRVGILMHGQRPSVSELWRWMRSGS